MRTRISSDRLLALTFLAVLVGVAAWSRLSGTPAGDVALVPCPVISLTGTPCPGCGMTRACVSLAQADPAAAWAFHPFAFLLVPLALCIGLWPARTRAVWARIGGRARTLTLGSALVACLGLWLSRLA